MVRSTAAVPLRSLSTLARKRERPANLVGEVGVGALGELGLVAGRHRRGHHGGEVVVVERRLALHALEVAASAQHRRLADAQVQVGRAGFDLPAQQVLEREQRRGARRVRPPPAISGPSSRVPRGLGRRGCRRRRLLRHCFRHCFRRCFRHCSSVAACVTASVRRSRCAGEGSESARRRASTT